VSQRQKPATPARRPRKRATSPKNPQFLKRTGSQPLAFGGAPILCATSFRPGPSLWYELNLYRVEGGGVVVQTIAYKKSDKENDIFHAEMFKTLDEAIDHIEAYDTEQDVEILDQDDDAHGAGLTLRSLLVRKKIDEARTEYRTLCGNVLFELANNADLKAA